MVDNLGNRYSASWRWFVVPAILVALAAAVLAITSRDDGRSDGSEDARVRAGSEAEPEPASEQPRQHRPLTATISDIGDGVVRAGPIGTQPFLSVQPIRITDAGFHDFVVTGEGWTSRQVFVLACGPEVVSLALEIGSPESCDLTNLTPVTLQEGEFEVVVEYKAPSGGFTIAAGDAADTESAVVFIQVG